MAQTLILVHVSDLWPAVWPDTFGTLTPGLHDASLTCTIPATSLEVTMSGWHAGDTSPPLSGQALMDGMPVDLTGAVCAIHIQTSWGSIINRAPVVTAGTNGLWSMPWQPTDLSNSGVFQVELEVTKPVGLVTTYGPVSLNVQPQLA